jgi:ubiquinone/menaquinone biosynthesis C-methylase UbiE
MKSVTKHNPTRTSAEPRHDYLPAAGRDAYLPFYDLLTGALGGSQVHRRLIDQAGLAAGQRVLEIGCGTGNLALRAKRSHPGIELVGCDPDPLALARARRKIRGLAGIRFEQAYAQRLPYPDSSFDRVLSALMLHHLDEDTQMAALSEVVRVLRPGGSLHLADFTGQIAGPHGFLARRMKKAAHVADNGEDGLPRLLAAAGLDGVEVASYRHPVMGQVANYRATRPA